ncbi:hypothetical protein EYV94_02125 [Puteibacter caeruleilacunae]|nr:hypothetical protein EYV94_02125 [Puteibacter caeruleilacunae]
MNKELFIENLRIAFGDAELPIVFWYSDEPAIPVEKTRGCFIGYLKTARSGGVISFNVDTIGCPGGKVYTGYCEAPPFIPGFVSEKEKYKKTPEMVTKFIDDLNMPDAPAAYINFASIDKISSLDDKEGIIFFATPDILSGLVSWALFDIDESDAISVPFGSGCSLLVSQTYVENKRNGYRCFLGLFDPSVRPSVEQNILSFAIPMSRFKVMYHTIEESCLSGTHGWTKVKERIEKGGE